MHTISRLSLVQSILKTEKIQGFILPRADCFQAEHIAPREERMAWLTGFTGSAGLLVMLPESAALFVDGRYQLQAEQQVDQKEIRVCPLSFFRKWVQSHFSQGDCILYDPWLHTYQQFRELSKIFGDQGSVLKGTDENLIDQLWKDRPAETISPLIPHFYGGESTEEKCKRLSAAMDRLGGKTLLLTSPESIAWLLNVRGNDVDYTPIFHSIALFTIPDNKIRIFVDLRKLTQEVRVFCGDNVIWSDFHSFFDELPQEICADPHEIPQKIFEKLAQAEIFWAPNPCLLLKANKNPEEQKGSAISHERDAIALISFLAWLDTTQEPVTEVSAASYLENQRKKQQNSRGLSFSSISSFGSNAALVHYRPTAKTDRPLQKDGLYLIDSGGQYQEGTTDVTRTLPIGIPTLEQKDRYTRVLKGNIALNRATFPSGTTGHQLDILARQFLWEVGLDYDHGTGHGVGSYLHVHEGPHSISKRQNSIPLAEGMIVSNEPGYYKAGEYGIRIENMMVVKMRPNLGEGWMGFDTLTLVPFDRRLIVVSDLSSLEREWIDNYHRRIWEQISPFLQGDVVHWLSDAVRALS